MRETGERIKFWLKDVFDEDLTGELVEGYKILFTESQNHRMLGFGRDLCE